MLTQVVLFLKTEPELYELFKGEFFPETSLEGSFAGVCERQWLILRTENLCAMIRGYFPDCTSPKYPA